MSDDRKIHARTAPHPNLNSLVLVRYNRGGKWFIEMEQTHSARPLSPKPAPPTAITVSDAALIAEKWEARGGTVFEGTPGGQVFDRKVRGLRAERLAAKLDRKAKKGASK